MLTYETSPLMRQMTDAFLAAEATTRFPADVGLAMSACESGWWKSTSGDFNYWGITANPLDLGAVEGQYSQDRKARLCSTHESITPAQLELFRRDERASASAVKDDNGTVVTLSGGRIRYAMLRWFASYSSLEDAVTNYVNLFIRSPQRYKSAWELYLFGGDSERLLKSICEAGYATGDAETTELDILHQSNIIAAVSAARSAARQSATG